MNLIFRALKYNFIQTRVDLCAISSFCVTVKLILWFLPHKLQARGGHSHGDAFALSSCLTGWACHLFLLSLSFLFFVPWIMKSLQAYSSAPKNVSWKKRGLFKPRMPSWASLDPLNGIIIPEAFSTSLEWNILLRINGMVTMQRDARNLGANLMGRLPSLLASTSSNESKVTYGRAGISDKSYWVLLMSQDLVTRSRK